MAEAIYILCAVLSACCAVLLFRQHHESRTQLTFWTGVGFTGLALNNAILVVDLVILPATIDLSILRAFVAVAAMGALVIGFVWHSH